MQFVTQFERDQVATTLSLNQSETKVLNCLLWQTPHKLRYQKTKAPKLLNLYQLPADAAFSMSISSNQFTRSNLSSLVAKIKDGDLRQLQEEIELRDYDVNEAINGRYALHFAADYGHADIIEYLLARGAQVNVTDMDGVTPLLAAIYEGRTRCVEILLRHGADSSGRTPDDKTYLEVADIEEIRELLQRK